MNLRSFSVICLHLSALNDALCKVVEIDELAERNSIRRKSKERISTEHTSLNHTEASQCPVKAENNNHLCAALEAKKEYEAIVLCDYEPADRRRHFEWLLGISLPFPFTLLRRAYGGNIGTMNFLLKIPVEKDKMDDTIKLCLN